MTNGSWTGRDTALRRLRTVAAIVILCLIAYVIIDPADDPATTVGSLVGALLVVLGFEAGINWPKGGAK